MKKIIFWKSKITNEYGHSMPIEAELADTWAEYGNKEYPDIVHQVVDADISKWKVKND